MRLKCAVFVWLRCYQQVRVLRRTVRTLKRCSIIAVVVNLMFHSRRMLSLVSSR